MPHITTHLIALALAAQILLGGCDGSASAVDEGIAAYEAGDYEAALASFREAGRDDPSALMLYDTALAALAHGDLGLAEASVDAAGASADGELAELVTFLRGNVAYDTAVATGKQADTVESEPFAFDLAISHAEDARDAWKEARAVRGDWPAAERNVARAEALLLDLIARKAESADRKKRKDAGGPPKIRPVPVSTAQKADPPEDATAQVPAAEPPIPPDGGSNEEVEPTQPGPNGAATAELPRAAVLRLLDVLAERERAKQATRRAERERTGGGVERDW